MDKLLLQDAEPYASAHRRKRRWYQVMTCLAAAVVFCTTYALILPAITLEKQCALPEHTHTEACYTSVQGDLICTQLQNTQPYIPERMLSGSPGSGVRYVESSGHTHGAECYDQEGNLICGQEESEGHVPWGEACCGVSRQLVCGQTEEPAHQHTDACYSWNQVLTCDLEEHTHSEACTATEPEKAVFCGKESHTHGESCRNEQGELTCGMEEHTHSEACTATEPEEAVFCGERIPTHGGKLPGRTGRTDLRPWRSIPTAWPVTQTLQRMWRRRKSGSRPLGM